MDIHSVLVLLDGGKGSEAAMRTAVRVGLEFTAHGEVLQVESPSPALLPVMSGDLPGTASMLDGLQEEADKRRTHAKAVFDVQCREGGLNIVDADAVPNVNEAAFTWHLISGHDNPELARRGRLVDLIVIARADEADGGVDSAVLEAALFDTGRPVLIAGNGDDDGHVERIAIAWDGSREAAHSLGFSIPFLQTAKEVIVLSVVDRNPVADADRLEQYLMRHGVKSQNVLVYRKGRSVARALRDEVAARGIDMVVMGAYGHSAMGEFFFGGVTRDMLKTAHLPLVLAH